MHAKHIIIGDDAFASLIKAKKLSSTTEGQVLAFANHRNADLIDTLHSEEAVSFHISELTLDKGGSGKKEPQGFTIVYPFLKYCVTLNKIKAEFSLYSYDSGDSIPNGIHAANVGDCWITISAQGELETKHSVSSAKDRDEMKKLYDHELNYIVKPISLPRSLPQPINQYNAMPTKYNIVISVLDDEKDQRNEIENQLAKCTQWDELFGVTLKVFAMDTELLSYIKEENDNSYGDVQAIILDWQLYGENNDIRVKELIQNIRTVRPNIHIYILTKSTQYADIVNTLVGIPKTAYHVKGEDYDGLWRKIKNDILKRMDTPFWKAYKEYTLKDNYSWHTPGHSGGNSFRRSPYIKDIYDFFGINLFKADLSVSVDELGSLFSGSGKVEDGQRYASKVFGTKRSYFVTNGSSTSNKIMLQYLLSPGNKVIVDRNCHKSVHYGLISGNYDAIYLNSEFSAATGFFAPPDKNLIYDAVEKNKDARLLILTGCTYDGIMMDLKDIIQEVKKIAPRMKVMIDEAWFCYSSFHPVYERFSALKSGADYVTHSAHKVLSAFSQASFIHVNDVDFDESYFMEAFCMNTSTSPQYNLIASLELAALQMEMEGFKLIETIRKEAIALAENFNRISEKIKIVSGEGLISKFASIKDDNCDTDPLKIVIDFSSSGLSMDEIQDAFKEKGIQIEKSTKQGFVLLLYTIGSSFSKTGNLYQLLLELDRKAKASRANGLKSIPAIPKDVLAIEKPSNGFHYYFFGKEKQYKTLYEVAEKIAQVNKIYNCHLIVPYPPGIPILIPGTEITKEKCNYLISLIQAGGEVHGLRNNQIAIIIESR